MNTLQTKLSQLNESNISSIFFSGSMFFLSIYTRNWQIACYVRDPLNNRIAYFYKIKYISLVFNPLNTTL